MYRSRPQLQGSSQFCGNCPMLRRTLWPCALLPTLALCADPRDQCRPGERWCEDDDDYEGAPQQDSSPEDILSQAVPESACDGRRVFDPARCLTMASKSGVCTGDCEEWGGACVPRISTHGPAKVATPPTLRRTGVGSGPIGTKLPGAEQRAQRPQMFYIREFVTAEEAREIISEAENQLRMSPMPRADDPNAQFVEQRQKQWQHRAATGEKEHTFRAFDCDGDGLLSEQEVRVFNTQFFHMANHNHTHLLDQMGTQQVTVDAFGRFDWLKYNQDMLKRRPHLGKKHLRQTWLKWTQSSSAKKVLGRVASALKAPEHVLRKGEPLQVVKYDRRGHLSCHTDAADLDLARFATLQIFLNDDFEGGVLAFPYANKTITNEEWPSLQQSCLPTHQCGSTNSSGILVQPKTGDAVFWNNVEAAENGRRLRLARESLRADCPVIKGTKWIANFWLPQEVASYVK